MVKTMFCETCGTPMPEDSRFCESCGSAVEAELQPEVAPIPEASSAPEQAPIPVVSQQISYTQPGPPEGFTYDQGSGLYYLNTAAPNPETGETGSWVTWYYPQTGEYKQVFAPDPIQPAGTAQIKPKAKVKLSPLNFIIPLAALLLGVLIALFVHS